MRVSFDFFSSPLEIKSKQINVLAIENKKLFRTVLTAFVNGNVEDENIVFSCEYKPIKFKGNVFVIDNYFSFDFSGAFIKKLYEEISLFCVNEMCDFTVKIKEELNRFFDAVIQSYDFDFSFKSEVELTDLFKIVNFKPDLMKETILETLVDFIFLIQKYTPQKCFILFNLHLFFTKDELKVFYEQIIKSDIRVLVIEGSCYEKLEQENITIVDEDMCEIVDFC